MSRRKRRGYAVRRDFFACLISASGTYSNRSPGETFRNTQRGYFYVKQFPLSSQVQTCHLGGRTGRGDDPVNRPGLGRRARRSALGTT
jgi:hypothetical protein